MFGQGVATGKDQRGPKSNKSKVCSFVIKAMSKMNFFLQIQVGFDPFMHALNAVDQYEDIQNNNVATPIVIDSESTLPTVVKASEESQHQVIFIKS